MLAAACQRGPIEWQDAEPQSADVPAAAQLHLDSAGAPTFLVPPAPLVALPPAACPGSASFARFSGEEWLAAWWAPRADGSLDLMAARSGDGGRTWGAPVTADARDRSRSGCGRPAPHLAADSAGGYVHAVYYLEPPDGRGVYYTHSMAMGAELGAVWHTPVGVVFGDGPVRAGVAAAGDTVVVAYESPNSVPRRIGLAISRVAGHVFEERVPVSGSGRAAEPRVALRGRTVAVAWREGPAGLEDTTGGVVMVRMGKLTEGGRRKEE